MDRENYGVVWREWGLVARFLKTLKAVCIDVGSVASVCVEAYNVVYKIRAYVQYALHHNLLYRG